MSWISLFWFRFEFWENFENFKIKFCQFLQPFHQIDDKFQSKFRFWTLFFTLTSYFCDFLNEISFSYKKSNIFEGFPCKISILQAGLHTNDFMIFAALNLYSSPTSPLKVQKSFSKHIFSSILLPFLAKILQLNISCYLFGRKLQIQLYERQENMTTVIRDLKWFWLIQQKGKPTYWTRCFNKQ